MFARAAFAAATLSAGVPAFAQPKAVQLQYAAYAAGFEAVAMQASIAMDRQSYRIQVSYRLIGLIGVVLHGESTTVVDGRFDGAAAAPRQMVSTGQFRGVPRVTQMVWRNGSPVVTQLVPPVETEREPVPAAEQAHTVDSLSAMAALLHQVATTGRCEGAMNTFDGRRLSAVAAHTVGEEVLPETGRSSFHGPALRCDFEGRQLAGFVRDQDPTVVRAPQRGSAWFARVQPGEAPVPVRITFHSRQFGDATVYLTDGS